FTPENKNIELNIDFNEESSSLHFEVKDEGIGISQDNIEDITKAFTQADSSTARKYGGSGLGLSIVSNLLKLFDSELKIVSKLNFGSTFSFDIKVKTLDNKSEDVESFDDINFTNKTQQ
ncbi:MAG: ATP-binding protein, partial [Campylobacterota bacterium]|nr:ATP-binding protein [Campylobacterota bacterium]